MADDDSLQVREKVLEIPCLGSEVIFQALSAQPVALLEDHDAELGRLHPPGQLTIGGLGDEVGLGARIVLTRLAEGVSREGSARWPVDGPSYRVV